MLARYRVGVFFLSAAVLAAGALGFAQPKTPAAVTSANVDDTYPKAYVCKDIQQTQVDDAPGTCQKDKTPLIPIRLGIAYKCLRGPANYSADATSGTRCYNGQPKGAVTVSVSWTCKSEQGRRYLDPGKCADGAARDIVFEERPHGDHNPRHGGLAIFMSPDLYYHVEGTYNPGGLFRVYFYNEFTKPLKVGSITGRVAIENSNSVATGPQIPLTVSNIADGNALEVRIPQAPVPSSGAPLYFKLYVTLKPGARDWITDHGPYKEYSKDPDPPAPGRAPATTGARATPPPATTARANPPSGTTSRPATPSITPPPAPPAAARPAPAPAPASPASSAPVPAEHPTAAASAAPPAAAPSPAPETPQTPQVTPESGPGPATGRAIVTVPQDKAQLLAFLKQNASDVKQLLDQGQLAGMWYPALNAKDAVLSLEASHHEGLTDAQRAKLSSDAKQLTVLAWEIDSNGDLGNRTELDQLTTDFEATANDILALYGQQ